MNSLNATVTIRSFENFELLKILNVILECSTHVAKTEILYRGILKFHRECFAPRNFRKRFSAIFFHRFFENLACHKSLKLSEAQLKKAALTFWIPGPGVQKMKPTPIKISSGWKTKKLLESSTAKEFQTFQESQKNCTLSFSKSSKKTAKMRRWKFFSQVETSSFL